MIFAVTALGAFMASLDLSIVNVAFPSLERSFPHDPRATLAWVITGYSIAFGSLLVTAGRTADRIGRKKAFFFGLGVFSLGSIACALAPDVPFLIVGRVVQGCGAAALLPASLGLLLVSFPIERRSEMVSLWAGVGALAVATGPTLGAVLVSIGGWRWAFYLNIPVAIVAFLIGRVVLPTTKVVSGSGSPDYLGVVLVSSSLAALVLGISQGPTWGWSSPSEVASLSFAVIVMAWFLRRSAHHDVPVLDLELFRERSFSIANLATALYAMGFFAMLLGNILFLTSVWHYSIIRAGLAITPAPLVVAPISGRAGRLANRIGFRPVIVAGSAILASGLVLYALRVSTHPAFLVDWLPATLLTGLGIGLTFPVLGAAAVSSLPADKLAVGSAVNQTSRQIGGAIGVAILVVILGTPKNIEVAIGNFRSLWLYAASTSVLSGVSALWLTSHDHHKVRRSSTQTNNTRW